MHVGVVAFGTPTAAVSLRMVAADWCTICVINALSTIIFSRRRGASALLFNDTRVRRLRPICLASP